jgi:hypothetical protein
MIFSKEDLDCLHSLYYNFPNFDIKLGRDTRDLAGEQWQINAPNKNKLWLAGIGTSVTEAYNSLMKRMSETGQFDPPEWNAAA